ncbi:uncharacterized protein T551_01264 [Pneumocystis jirovecii RU7]|uniref:Uncharacterized protein n=1 Tax=Pneumocystis jirovecii (strain RU7) TaxID=1408657 RepID=A0A0W4ZS28_PNEJ7|nr:uncharacterized protein T551_01264 [Pneumocystis jirovecii RU7]KTW31191.1 hypothetical protein T551_01264 [Pneumocystis jirovecii RU7]
MHLWNIIYTKVSSTKNTMGFSALNKISLKEGLSGIFGSISLASWIITVYPQLIENYRRKSGDSISLPFLFLWLVGDIFGLIGYVKNCVGEVLNGRKISMGEAYTYYYCYPVLYYKHRYHLRNNVQEKVFKGTTPLQVFLSMLIVIVFGVLGWIITVAIGGVKKPDTQTPNSVGFLVFGYIGAFLYCKLLIGNHMYLFLTDWYIVFARIPQIKKNFESKSTEGLSLLFFVFTLLGNITYAISILLIDVSRKYIMMNLPWLLGSLGTLSMDILIFFQFMIYKRKENGNST